MSDCKGVNRMFLGIIGIYVLVSLGSGYLMPNNTPVYVRVLLSQMILLLPALFYCKRRKIAIRQLIPYKKIKFSTAVLVVIVTYLMYPLMIVLNALTLFFTNSGAQEMVQGQMQQGGFLSGVFFVAVIPACVEEFVFRGVLLQTYRKSALLPGILLSAFLFGCMHMNLNQMVYALAMGIWVAFLVEATGSILSSMLAHFTLNFTSVVMTWVLEQWSEKMDMSQEMVQVQGNFLQMGENTVLLLLIGVMMWSAIALGTTAAAVAIYIYICKSNQRWDWMKQRIRQFHGENMITLPVILAVIVTMIIIILRI